MTRLKVGIAQYKSEHLDLPKSLQKLEAIVSDAASHKVDLVVFGETWLSGYPAWLDHCPDIGKWDYEPMKEVFLKLYRSSISIPGGEFDFIASLARRHKIWICIGINEKITNGKANGSVYNSILIFNADGNLVNHHRKLVPTFTEKLLYGHGDAAGLNSVKSPWGRVGALVCWEHWMPLTRQALHDSGEHIHLALWPTVHTMHELCSRHYAFEGRCFVVAVGQMLSVADFPQELTLPPNLKSNPHEHVLRGGSCIIGPRGNLIVEPVFEREQLIVEELDIDEAVKERMTLDTSGHYQRPDIFNFEVNKVRHF